MVIVFFWVVLNVSSLKGISDGQTNSYLHSSLKSSNFLSHARIIIQFYNTEHSSLCFS